MSYEPVIGLEIHAQLNTKSKIFCGCSTAFGHAPNTHVCPVCLGLPGALPVLNRQAVDHAITAGLALGCDIQGLSVFARKNYFYPDLPKGYQISQYARPLALGGGLDIVVEGDIRQIRLTRIHMEEDAGKSVHDGFIDSSTRTYVDFNRSGVPLVEIVSEPDLRSPAEAVEFFAGLRDILVWLGINDGNMEEGSLRCDANVSVRLTGADALGTKAEVKNLNSFRHLEKALQFEIRRQIDLVTRGERVIQETRLWDASAERTAAMRSKEEAHDYRYFPEADLPPLVVTDARVERLRKALPELPAARRARLTHDYRLPAYDAGVLTQSPGLADYFEAVARASGNGKAASNWVMGELLRVMNERNVPVDDVPLAPEELSGLIGLVDDGTISHSTAKEVFARMLDTGRSAKDIVGAEGLAQIGDTAALEAVIRQVLEQHADAAAQYRSGKHSALDFLVGQVMKGTRGKANPRVVNALLGAALSAEDADGQ